MDGIWLYVAPVKTAVDLQLSRNKQVETSVCRIQFDDSSANVTLFSYRIFLKFRKVFGCLRDICILTKACSFASWQILT